MLQFPFSGTLQTVATDFENPLALVVDRSQGCAIVIDNVSGDLRASTIDLASGTVVAEVTSGLEDLTQAAISATITPGILFVAGPSHEIRWLDLTGSPPVAGPSLGADVRGLACWGSLVLAVTSTHVEAREWGIEKGPLPVQVPLGPVYVRGYFRAEVDFAAAGLSSADVEFVVKEGPTAGSVSAGVEPPNAAGRRWITVLAGSEIGELHLLATHRTTGELLALSRFRVTSLWPNDDIGPPVAVTGEQQVFARGSWGGGPAGPQNIRIHPAPDDWRVAVVLISLKDNRFPANVDAVKTDWKDRLNSARRYYEEVSYFGTSGPAGAPSGTTVSLADGQIFGPIDLDYGWGDCFDPELSGLWFGWNAKDAFFDQCAFAFSGFLQDRGIAASRRACSSGPMQSCSSSKLPRMTASRSAMKHSPRSSPGRSRPEALFSGKRRFRRPSARGRCCSCPTRFRQ